MAGSGGDWLRRGLFDLHRVQLHAIEATLPCITHLCCKPMSKFAEYATMVIQLPCQPSHKVLTGHTAAGTSFAQHPLRRAAPAAASTDWARLLTGCRMLCRRPTTPHSNLCKEYCKMGSRHSAL